MSIFCVFCGYGKCNQAEDTGFSSEMEMLGKSFAFDYPRGYSTDEVVKRISFHNSKFKFIPKETLIFLTRTDVLMLFTQAL